MFIKRLLSLFLLLVLPTLAMQRIHDRWDSFFPNMQRSMPQQQLQKGYATVFQGIKRTPWNSTAFKYDDILTFLNDLESGELEARCSEQDLEQINQFVADLAREGHIPNMGGDPQELEQDIEELLGISDPYAFRYAAPESTSFELAPALYYGEHEVLTCGWLKKAWKSTKKFCKKHKKAIIIGAVTVVAITTVIVVAVAASSSTVAGGAVAAAGSTETGGAAGGAAAGAAALMNSKSKKSDEQPSTTPGVNDAIASRPDPTPAPLPQAPKPKSPPEVERIVERHIENFRETIAEGRPAVDVAKPNEPLSFEEAVRVHGAYAAREAISEVVGSTISGQDASRGPLAELDSAFGISSSEITPMGAALAAGRVANRIPGKSPVKVVATAGVAACAAAYTMHDPEGAQRAYDVVCGGANYVADKAREGVTYVKDCVIEAGESLISWAAGTKPTTSLESRSGDTVADDRVLQPPQEYFEGFPDRPLPRDLRTGEPAGDVDVPHTQLGTRDSKKGRGKYRQAREFDAEGKEVCRDDYSYHNDPTKHTNPHRHWIMPNETGGTPKIEDGVLLPGYNYEQ